MSEQQRKLEEINKSLLYISERCKRCPSCESSIDVSESVVIKIKCPLCKCSWCMLCGQTWTMHGVHTGGLQVCKFVQRKLCVE